MLPKIEPPRRGPGLDGGPMNFRLGTYDGDVIVQFPRPVEVMRFTKEEARAFAQNLLLHAGGIIIAP